MLELHSTGAAARARLLVQDWKQMVSPKTFGQDLSGALTVACVALPLNLALAVASGLPASVGSSVVRSPVSWPDCWEVPGCR